MQQFPLIDSEGIKFQTECWLTQLQKWTSEKKKQSETVGMCQQCYVNLMKWSEIDAAPALSSIHCNRAGRWFQATVHPYWVTATDDDDDPIPLVVYE